MVEVKICGITNASDARLAAAAQGLLYYSSILGLTGTAAPSLDYSRSKTAAIGKITDLPLMVGFGFFKPGQVRAAASLADGVVVGSALVRRIHDFHRRKDWIRPVSVYVRQLKRALPLPP
jgi:tryptophan synthase alpha chain